MPDHSPDNILTFKGHAIRIAILDGVPWFSAVDICEAMDIGRCACLKVHSPDFPAYARRDCFDELATGETVDATLISPVGVWLLTDLIAPARFQQLAAWARKEAQRLCLDPKPNDPAMVLTLFPDGKYPPRPFRYSGRLAEWLALQNMVEQERRERITRGEMQRLAALEQSTAGRDLKSWEISALAELRASLGIPKETPGPIPTFRVPSGKPQAPAGGIVPAC